MGNRPTLLFVSPVVPKFAGPGIAMRPAMHLSELSSSHDITLAIVLDGQKPADAKAEIPEAVATLCREILITSKQPLAAKIADALPDRLGGAWRSVFRTAPQAQRRGALRELARVLGGRRFDALHCFRLVTGGFPRLSDVRAAHSALDMDDYESRARRRYADTLLRARSVLHFAAGRMEAVLYRAFEAEAIPAFDEIFVCSQGDCDLLAARFPDRRVTVAPNVMAPPALASRSPDRPFTFLFVGTLDYPPNTGAVLHFCRDIVPILRAATSQPFRVAIVGLRPPREILALRDGDIEVAGNVPDVAPYYARAGAVVAPLATGGGTRIKIIEAFSQGVPVVSTTIGAEGLEVVDGRDILIADGAAAFAKACQRLLYDDDLRRRMSAAGLALFERCYTPRRLAQSFAAVRGAQPVYGN